MSCCVVCCVQEFRGCVQDLGAPPEAPSLDRPKFRTFFPRPLPFSLFFSLSLGVCLLVEFWWFLKRRGTLKCARLGPSASKTPPKFHEKTLQERAERKKIVAGEGKKRNFGLSTLRDCFGAPARRAHPSGPHFQPTRWPKTVTTCSIQIGLKRCWPKAVLAKSGTGQNRSNGLA